MYLIQCICLLFINWFTLPVFHIISIARGESAPLGAVTIKHFAFHKQACHKLNVATCYTANHMDNLDIPSNYGMTRMVLIIRNWDTNTCMSVNININKP